MASSKPEVRELDLAEIARGGAMHDAFIALHAEWIDRGLERWLGLLAASGVRPVMALGAFDRAHGLVGAVIGVWSEAPLERFDALFENQTAFAPSARPAHGAWHLIAVTTLPSAQVRDLGLGRLLLGKALAELAASGHAEARTMSPAFGLPELARVWPGSLEDAVLHAARADARPALQVMRLHLGGGARLERVLAESRRDDRASGRVNLRFRYATDPELRRAQRDRWSAWVAARLEHALALVAQDFAGAPLFRADGSDDALVCGDPINQIEVLPG